MANIWPTTLPVGANNKLTGTIFNDFMLGEPPGGALYDPPSIPAGNWGVPGGNDTFVASRGNDTIDGGDRIQKGGSLLDCVDYSAWGQKIYANLNLPTVPTDDDGNPVAYVDPFGVSVPLVGSVYKGVIGGVGYFDTFVAAGYTGLAATQSSIEGIIGTAFNDEMLGDAKANKFKGNAGNDKIYGGGGNDTITGDAGNDTLNGDDGNDTIRRRRQQRPHRRRPWPGHPRRRRRQRPDLRQGSPRQHHRRHRQRHRLGRRRERHHLRQRRQRRPVGRRRQRHRSGWRCRHHQRRRRQRHDQGRRGQRYPRRRPWQRPRLRQRRQRPAGRGQLCLHAVRTPQRRRQRHPRRRQRQRHLRLRQRHDRRLGR